MFLSTVIFFFDGLVQLLPLREEAAYFDKAQSWDDLHVLLVRKSS